MTENSTCVDERTFGQSWSVAENRLNLEPGQIPVTQRQFVALSLWDTVRSFVPATCQRSLEIGAGRGTLSRYLATLGLDVTLVDIEEQATKLARGNFAGIPATFITGDIYSLSFEKPFDLVVSVGLMEHLEDLPGLLRKVNTLLKPEGRLISYNAPAKWSTQSLINWIYGRLDYKRVHFPLKSCVDMLRNTRFNIVEAFWYKPYPIFNTELLHRDKPILASTERFITAVYCHLARLRGRNHMKTNRLLAIGYLVVADKSS
ncbi:MAG: class I SAM-dependent methyltransferase [Deltaproteobacteria bacterium]|nr:class I SAM-dependent methyltransferase [Deltaproteobacteria bacterium]